MWQKYASLQASLYDLPNIKIITQVHLRTRIQNDVGLFGSLYESMDSESHLAVNNEAYSLMATTFENYSWRKIEPSPTLACRRLEGVKVFQLISLAIWRRAPSNKKPCHTMSGDCPLRIVFLTISAKLLSLFFHLAMRKSELAFRSSLQNFLMR